MTISNIDRVAIIPIEEYESLKIAKEMILADNVYHVHTIATFGRPNKTILCSITEKELFERLKSENVANQKIINDMINEMLSYNNKPFFCKLFELIFKQR